MNIKMKTLQAGPHGVRVPDGVYDVPTAEAEALIAGGYAVEVKVPVKAAAVVDAVDEEAAPAPAPEPEQAKRSARSFSRKAVKST